MASTSALTAIIERLRERRKVKVVKSDFTKCRACDNLAYKNGYGCTICDCDVEDIANETKLAEPPRPMAPSRKRKRRNSSLH